MIGRDLGTTRRNEIVRAGLDATAPILTATVRARLAAEIVAALEAEVPPNSHSLPAINRARREGIEYAYRSAHRIALAVAAGTHW